MLHLSYTPSVTLLQRLPLLTDFESTLHDSPLPPIELLKALSSLQKLKLDGYNLPADCFAYLPSSLTSLLCGCSCLSLTSYLPPNLLELDTSSSELSTHQVEHIIKSLHHLQEFTLTANSSEHLDVFDAFSFSTSLRILKFTWYRFQTQAASISHPAVVLPQSLTSLYNTE